MNRFPYLFSLLGRYKFFDKLVKNQSTDENSDNSIRDPSQVTKLILVSTQQTTEITIQDAADSATDKTTEHRNTTGAVVFFYYDSAVHNSCRTLKIEILFATLR